MRIGVNTRLLLPGTLEGIGRFTHEVLRRMVRDHPEDEFYFFFDRSCDEKYLYAENVKPVILGPQSRHPVLWYWWFEKSVSKALIQNKIDVFFTPELYCCLSVDIPTLMIIHDLAYAHYPRHIPFSHRTYLEHFVPRFIRRADKIGCVSEATKDDVKSRFEIEEEKLFVSFNGPTPGFKPLTEREKEVVRMEITEGKPYFVYIGSMHPRKNIGRLILAYDQFRKNNPSSDHKLVLIGRLAWMSGRIKEAYDESPFQEDILPLGQKNDAAKIVGAAEAMVYVSLFEGFGIPILEAMQCEIPVVTSNVSSMPEVVGEAGVQVDPKEVESIAKGMEEILDKKFQKTLIDLGRGRLSNFSWDKTSRLIYGELKKLS
jgi:glycosyltransferase involved in cell wall biosynthesis